MKKLLIIIILSSVFSISSIGQSMVVTPTYSPFSFSDIATPLIIATEVHREVENRINNLKLYIIDANKVALELGLGNKISTVMESIIAKISGVVKFERLGSDKKKVSVYPVEEKKA